MKNCWFCHRTFEEAQRIISELPSDFRQLILEELKDYETKLYVCPLCLYLLNGLFLRFQLQALKQKIQKE